MKRKPYIPRGQKQKPKYKHGGPRIRIPDSEKHSFVCEYCGAEIPWRYDRARREHHYCNYQCFWAARGAVPVNEAALLDARNALFTDCIKDPLLIPQPETKERIIKLWSFEKIRQAVYKDLKKIYRNWEYRFKCRTPLKTRDQVKIYMNWLR